jgi:hypothetical protein
LVDAPGTIGTHPKAQKFFGSFLQKRTASFLLMIEQLSEIAARMDYAATTNSREN